MKPKSHSEDIFRRTASFAGDIIAWRRALHQHPELSFHEERTADFVGEVLLGEGILHRRRVGGHGVVADIHGGPGPIIGLRADMDALALQEDVPSAFASENPGVMHACGHDAHTAMLLGAARVLKGCAEEGGFAGTVRLIFQPAEEQIDAAGKSGAQYMIEDGVLDGLSAVVAQHVSPSVEAGRMSFVRGTINASSDYFEIIVRGRAAHGAMPHLGVDAIVAASAIVQGVQQIVSRKINPLAMGVVNIGTINGGTSQAVVADRVCLKGTIRAFDEGTRRTLKEEVGKVCTLAEALGASTEFLCQEGYPVGRNDAAITELAEGAIRRYLGEEAVHPSFGPSTGSEDFSFMTARVPGTLMRVGVRHPDWPEPFQLHTPRFQIDERALTTGAAALALVALEYLRAQ